MVAPLVFKVSEKQLIRKQQASKQVGKNASKHVAPPYAMRSHVDTSTAILIALKLQISLNTSMSIFFKVAC